jgi:hypothetical protein
MKWGKLSDQLFMSNYPDWLNDQRSYSHRASEPRGSRIHVVKRPGPVFDVSIKPWWGPKITFDGVRCPSLEGTYREATELVLTWECPSYQLAFDGEVVASKVDSHLAKAAELGLPYSIYEEIEGKKGEYLVRRPPEPCDAWEFSEFPRHLMMEYGIREGTSEIAFNCTPSNATQRAREQLIAWSYASCIAKATSSDPRHIALLIPKEDRGVDVYLRLLKVGANPTLAIIPLQICEVPLHGEGPYDERVPETIRNATLHKFTPEMSVEDLVSSIVARSKQKRRSGVDDTLLVKVWATSPIPGEMMLDRDAFEAKGDWPFTKIVMVGNCPDGNEFAYTAYCKPPCQHFFIGTNKGEFGTWVGRSASEIEERCASGIPNTIRF